MSLYSEHPLHIGGIEPILASLSSISIIATAITASYLYYVRHKADYKTLLIRIPLLSVLHKVFWNRWYIDKFYELVFVKSVISVRSSIQDRVERAMDAFLNKGVPMMFSKMYYGLRSMQTGLLSINMLYVFAFLAIMIIFVLLVM